ncbi:MAG: rhodanese-like domain-containing protein [Armatimonadetes bacterium]|nr:rhodanese-like domain-containing protein [Anaerolineae bacterium]
MTPDFLSLEQDDYKTRFYAGGAAHLLLDVRTLEEYETVRIPGALLIPLDELPERIAEIPTTAPIVLVCRSGMRSQMAAQFLRHAGLGDVTLYNLEGGTQAWARRGWETVSGEVNSNGG